MPHGAKANSHYHEDIDTIACLLAGGCAVYHVDRLELRLDVTGGEQVFMPRDVPQPALTDSGAPQSGSWSIRRAAARTTSS